MTAQSFQAVITQANQKEKSHESHARTDGLRTSQLVPDTVKRGSQLGPKAAARYAADAEETHAPAQTFLPTAAKSLPPQTGGHEARSQPLYLYNPEHKRLPRRTHGEATRPVTTAWINAAEEGRKRTASQGDVCLLRAKP